MAAYAEGAAHADAVSEYAAPGRDDVRPPAVARRLLGSLLKFEVDQK